jgi:hypothetical protein
MVGFMMRGGNHLAGIVFLAAILFLGSISIYFVKTKAKVEPPASANMA